MYAIYLPHKNSSTLNCLALSVSSQKIPAILQFLAISCTFFIEQSVSRFQLSTYIDPFSLSLISPLMSLIQLQSLRLNFSIGLIQRHIRTTLFPLSRFHVLFSFR